MLQDRHLLNLPHSLLKPGQRQRTPLGRSAVRADVLFSWDEPLSHLDAKLSIRWRADRKEMSRPIGPNRPCTSLTTYVEAMIFGIASCDQSRPELRQWVAGEVYFPPGYCPKWLLFLAIRKQYVYSSSEPASTSVRFHAPSADGSFPITADRSSAVDRDRSNCRLGFRPATLWWAERKLYSAGVGFNTGALNSGTKSF